MDISLKQAAELALNQVARDYRESLAIIPVESPDQFPYGFNPQGWVLFSISETHATGATKYAAVNYETGETRSYYGNDE